MILLYHIKRHRLRTNPSFCKQIFKLLDCDNDGCIGIDDIETHLGDFLRGKNSIRALIREIDGNGDGKIDEDEFLRAMKEECVRPIPKDVIEVLEHSSSNRLKEALCKKP
eukprot:UN00977